MEKRKYEYDYPMPSLTADTAVFKKKGDELLVLLVRRRNPPCKGYYALPGGFMEIGEKLETCARRELEEETGIRLDPLKPVKLVTILDDVERDPRGRVVSAVFTAMAADDAEPTAGDDAESAEWIKVADILDGNVELAFDHRYAVTICSAFLSLR